MGTKEKAKEVKKAFESIFEELQNATKEYEEQGHLEFDTITEDDERYKTVSEFLDGFIMPREKEKPIIYLDLTRFKTGQEIYNAIIEAKEKRAKIVAENYMKIKDDYHAMPYPFNQYRVAKDGTHIINTYNNIVKLPSANRDNYRKYYLYNLQTEEMQSVYAHRAVAMTYLPEEDGKEEVDHIDRNRANNHLSNLRWCSRTENINNRDY